VNDVDFGLGIVENIGFVMAVVSRVFESSRKRWRKGICEGKIELSLRNGSFDWIDGDMRTEELFLLVDVFGVGFGSSSFFLSGTSFLPLSSFESFDLYDDSSGFKGHQTRKMNVSRNNISTNKRILV